MQPWKGNKFCYLQWQRWRGGYYAKWNKSDKDKYCILYCIVYCIYIPLYLESEEYNKLGIKQKRSSFTDIENKAVVIPGEREGGGAIKR